MSRLDQALDRLRAGDPAVLIDEEHPSGGHLVWVPDADGPARFAALGCRPAARIVSDTVATHGVLGRPGPHEAAVDALRIAGLEPDAYLAALALADGVLAAEDAAERFAGLHGLAIFSVQDVIALRLARETIVEALAVARLPSAYAERPLEIQAFRGRLDGIDHVAMIHGPLGREPLVRLHSECLTGDALGSLRCDCGEQLRRSLRLIGESPDGGVVVYLRGQEGRGIGLANKIRAYALQDRGRDTVEANEDLGFPADQRDYAVAVQILQHLRIGRLRLLSNNPVKGRALERYGIEVVERVGIGIGANPHNAAYLETKRDKLGHDLAGDAGSLADAAE